MKDAELHNDSKEIQNFMDELSDNLAIAIDQLIFDNYKKKNLDDIQTC